MLKKIFKNLSRYPRLRILLIIGAILGTVVVVANVVAPAPKEDQQSRLPPSQVSTPRVNPTETRTVGAPPAATPVPAKKPSIFEGLFNEEKSPTLKPPVVTPTSMPAANKVSVAPPSNIATPGMPASSVASTQLSHSYAQPAGSSAKPIHYTSEQEQVMSKMAVNIQSYLNNSSKEWALPTAASVVAAQPSGTAAGTSGATAAGTAPVMIKAGAIMFAVLGTALNSDQINTPVLADMVSGPYKGARLLGKFMLADDKLVVQFNLMSMPSWPNSIAINAYAINADTGENALASGVDNHYLSRYGSLFAASFLQGYGQAFATAGTGTTACQAGSTCNITTTDSQSVPTPSVSSATYQGLGQVGTNLGAAVGQNFNRPPTVTLNQGVGLGILFVSDVVNPAFATTGNTNS